MVKGILKSIVNGLSENRKLQLAQYLASDLTPENKAKIGKSNLTHSLSQLKKLGYDPTNIIDIGAHKGDWTLEVLNVFPDSKYYLFEPLPNKKELLQSRFNSEQFELHHVLLGHEFQKEVTFYSMESGSSVMNEKTSFPREKITLEMHTLDELIKNKITASNTLFKIDVQGFELEVFKGSVETLKNAEVICIEVSLLNYNEGAPLIDEIIPQLKNYGFVPYDFIGFFRKNTDHGLIQTDMLFIKEDSDIRNKMNDFNDPNFQVVKV